MPKELPQFYMFPWKYFFSLKHERSEEIKKRAVYVRGRFPYSCVLLRFRNTLVAG
jgi:hypothetical protein